jgi:hypothetical protein
MCAAQYLFSVRGRRVTVSRDATVSCSNPVLRGFAPRWWEMVVRKDVMFGDKTDDDEKTCVMCTECNKET